jgi:hypothetical protein
MVKQLLLIFLMIPALSFAASDKKMMSDAREQFAAGNMKKAIQLYSKITPDSDFWLESIEERAWSWTRLNEYENALADLQSITSPVWSSQVGPETYMLSTFVSLKMCNYKEVLNKMNLFKKRMLFRIDALDKLNGQTLSKEFQELIPDIKSSKLNMVQLGKNAELYPRYFFRDTTLIQALKSGQSTAAAQRLKVLADADLKEIQTNLKKMKIIEVEMMQTVLMADKTDSKKEKLDFSSVDRNHQVTFPVTDDEVWIDEVGQYQVRAQKCAARAKKVL